MKTIICAAICFFSVNCFGQTKLISHRSHSGDDATFRVAVEHDLFDIGNSNFGLRTEWVQKIDTVIFRSPTKIVVVWTKYTTTNLGPKHYNQTHKAQILTKAEAAPVFKAQSSDSLKAELRKMYKTYKMDSTLFIGFDKQFKKKTDL